MLKELVAERERMQERIAICMNDLDSINEQIEKIVSEPFEKTRAKTGKDYGVVNLTIEGVKVKHDVPKKVKWDQDCLNDVWKKIENANDDPESYIKKKVSLSVPEKSYKDYPEEIKSVFEPARTVEPGNPKITFNTTED